uniref:Uncharacterized protein n=1 Tax=Anguilla anguilla TaxID=7936 RepID=A0A0E9TL54_ANGAN
MLPLYLFLLYLRNVKPEYFSRKSPEPSQPAMVQLGFCIASQFDSVTC